MSLGFVFINIFPIYAYVKVNKQLNDKERVAAALENPVLLETVEQCLVNVGARGSG